jgi:hypothetical protein
MSIRFLWPLSAGGLGPDHSRFTHRSAHNNGQRRVVVAADIGSRFALAVS